MQKVIAVFGATGLQGGSVLKYLVQSNKYHVKAITRYPDSDKAKKLAQLKNCSVHKADLNDPDSIDYVLKDCYGVFLVTEFKLQTVNREKIQGINLINSAIENKLTHIVYSGMENVKKMLKKRCYLTDHKAEVENYGLKRSNEIIFTSIRLPAYYQCLLDMLIFKDNQFIFSVPIADSYIYSMDVNESGKCVEYIFDNPQEFKSKIVPVAADKITPNELIEIYNEYLSPYTFINGNFSLENYLETGFPNVDDFAALFEFIRKGFWTRDIELTLKMNRNSLKFRDWVEQNKEEMINYLFLNKI